jgi:hypothetical protein
VKKCFGIGVQVHTFFENIHGMCKHCPIVVFHIILGNFYIMFEHGDELCNKGEINVN